MCLWLLGPCCCLKIRVVRAMTGISATTINLVSLNTHDLSNKAMLGSYFVENDNVGFENGVKAFARPRVMFPI